MPTPPDDSDERLARQRVEENPTDLALRFHLGHCLVRLNKHKEAVVELQKARQHPRHRREAMQLLARSFTALGLSDQADQTNHQIKDEDHNDDDEPDDPGGAASLTPVRPVSPIAPGHRNNLPKQET